MGANKGRIGKMNFKHEICEWSGHKFIRVSEKRYDNFIRYFENLNRIEGNFFMDWHDSYDWSLNNNIKPTKNTPKKVFYDCLAKCKVARCYYGGPKSEYWIRLDYIEANGYDIDTIVPKPRKPRNTRQLKMITDHLCDAFDYIFRLEATSKAKQQPSIRSTSKKKGNKKVDKELLEKASKVRSVGNTMGQFDIYLDEFIEKEKQ